MHLPFALGKLHLVVKKEVMDGGMIDMTRMKYLKGGQV
jgi:hypothetical protein